MPPFDRFFGRKNDERRDDSVPPANTAPSGPSEPGDPAGKALIAFLNAPSLEEKHAILQRDQLLLLTDTIIGLVQAAMRTQQAVGNPEVARQYRQDGALLLMAREQGIPAAWSAYLAAAIAAQLDSNPLFPVVDGWLATPSYRAERRYLEAHLELLEPGSDEVLTALATRYQNDAGHARDVREHLALLQDIRARGHDVQSVRDSYVNAMGGFRLDLPPWVEELEQRDSKLRQQGAGGVAPRVTMLRQAAERAGADATLAPEIVAEIYLRLWTALSEVAGPDRPSSQEEGLVALQQAERRLPRERYPKQWGIVQHDLGVTYRARQSGDPAENVEQAIAAYEAALTVRSPAGDPDNRAVTEYNLGNALVERQQGDRRENLQRAIAAYQAALQGFDPAQFAQQRSAAQHNLDVALDLRARLASGSDSGSNELVTAPQSVDALLAALETQTREQAPDRWAQLQAALADAYLSSTDGDTGENIERAIAAYQSVLQVWTRDRAPVAWAKIHYNLGDAYARRPRGTHLENQQKAIAAYSVALEVFTRATHPLEFAAAKNNLGTVYLMPGTGTVAQNADKAIAAFDAALEVYTADQYPQDRAQTQRNRDHAIRMRDGLRGLGL